VQGSADKIYKVFWNESAKPHRNQQSFIVILTTEVKMQDLKEHCDIEIKWHLLYQCNFQCQYCFSMSKWKKSWKVDDIDKIVDSFNRLGRTCHIFLTGGEPFLFPNFVDLCKKLTERHIISIVTNLSHKDVYWFIEEIDPSRVRFIICNIHMQERLRLNLVEDYIKKYHLLKDKGFIVVLVRIKLVKDAMKKSFM